MEEDQHQRTQPPEEKRRSPRFNVHAALVKQGSVEPRDPQKDAEALRQREERVRQRLKKLLRRRYPSSKVPALLSKMEKSAASLEELEERVRQLETIPSVIWELDRGIHEVAAQVRPILEASAEFSQRAPQLKEIAEQVRTVQPYLDEANERFRAIEPHVEEVMKATEEIRPLQPTSETMAAKNFGSIAAKSIDSIAAKNLGSVASKDSFFLAAKNLGMLAFKDLLPEVAKISATAVEAASRSFSEVDAVNAAMEQLNGGAAMSRSIMGGFDDRIYGYNSAVRKMEKALDAGREFERATSLSRETELLQSHISAVSAAIEESRAFSTGAGEMVQIPRELALEEQYRRTVGLDPSHLNAMREISASRDLLEAALRPIPNLGSLLSTRGARRTNAFGAFRRLNQAIAQAPLVGELEVRKEEIDEGQAREGAEEAPQDLESRLVKPVQAEVLAQFKVPLSELNRVLRHPEAMRMLTARDFERFIATLVEQLGFEDVVLTPPSGDQGRDIVATRKVSGITVFFAFECKRHAPGNPVGPDIMRALLGTILQSSTRASQGVLVTTSTFTPAARKFILTEPAVDGRDFDGVVDWLREYNMLTRAKSAAC